MIYIAVKIFSRNNTVRRNEGRQNGRKEKRRERRKQRSKEAREEGHVEYCGLGYNVFQIYNRSSIVRNSIESI